ncbi:hypothetical protein [Vibrio vulnificus YJ016]|uniref:Uncharacterized protein n=1 Tax=Vibrio vulnificus (strain YJ016) TaxID=196600 RepID=Q7MHJ9_VIBVY|nr:hypothetical protein [Vibrio vulnificus YJ016]
MALKAFSGDAVPVISWPMALPMLLVPKSNAMMVRDINNLSQTG